VHPWRNLPVLEGDGVRDGRSGQHGEDQATEGSHEPEP
jgi:hypothetical protein